MNLVTAAPYAAGIAFVVFALSYSSGLIVLRRNAWMLPAGLAVAFLAWSLAAIVLEGPLGFWTEHTRNLWGIQIWFDLLLAGSMALTFIVPKAKAVGMNPVIWVVLMFLTGSIALLAMTARLLYLQEKAESTKAGPARAPAAGAAS